MMVSLVDLPQDVMFHILIHLHRGGNSLKPFAETCRAFYQVFDSVRLGGKYALPVRLPVPARTPRGLYVHRSEEANDSHENHGSTNTAHRRSRVTRIHKTGLPGDAHMVFERDITRTSSVWRVRLDRFSGHRIEIGVALPSAFRFGMVERASSWSFDCFGRACIAGHQKTYGRQMQAGDTLTVVYDACRGTLSFLDNGMSMGELPVRPSLNESYSTSSATASAPASASASVSSLEMMYGERRHVPLFPFIYFPYLQGEAVSLLDVKHAVVDLGHVHGSAKLWRRIPSKLPFDSCIIVSTWEEPRWYAIAADPDCTTLAELWKELERRHGLEMHMFELIFNGKRLPYSVDKTLRDVGITIDKRTGSCSADILLNVPHIIS